MKIGVLVGSLRKESFTRKIAKEMVAMSQLDCEFVEIGNLTHYNEDLDKGSVPKEWEEFRKTIDSCEGFLFFTPEYNRSIPGVLKNALDVGSRPYGSSKWSGKPAAVVSVSPGALAAFGANHHIRQCFVFLDLCAMQQPEAYIGNVTQILDDSGKVKDTKTKEFMQTFMNKFEEWTKNFVK